MIGDFEERHSSAYRVLDRDVKDYVRMRTLNPARPTLDIILLRELKRDQIIRAINREPSVLDRRVIQLVKSLLDSDYAEAPEVVSECSGLLRLNLDEKNAMGLSEERVRQEALDDNNGWLNFQTFQVC